MWPFIDDLQANTVITKVDFSVMRDDAIIV